MNVLENYDLTKLNTFGISAKAKFFAVLEKEADIKGLFSLSQFKENKCVFIGGGSNVLFTADFGGIVVLNKLRGIEILDEDEDSVTIRSLSGEVWHDLVLFTVERGLWGIENLSLIPGSVGAAPMQNVGAYGAELANTLVNIEAYDIKSGEKRIFKNEECELGYRDSIFKNKVKGKYFISAITLKLSKVEKQNLAYKSLTSYLEKNKITVKSSKDISDAVTAVRRAVLPDPAVIPNAGSFFKNVFLDKERDKEKLKEMLATYPDMPYFEDEHAVKIPTGWLVENSGPARGGASWKGYRNGNVGVHEKHALVLVNYGGASGQELADLAMQIKDSVQKKFGLTLEPEVNLI